MKMPFYFLSTKINVIYVHIFAIHKSRKLGFKENLLFSQSLRTKRIRIKIVYAVYLIPRAGTLDYTRVSLLEVIHFWNNDKTSLIVVILFPHYILFDLIECRRQQIYCLMKFDILLIFFSVKNHADKIKIHSWFFVSILSVHHYVERFILI